MTSEFLSFMASCQIVHNMQGLFLVKQEKILEKKSGIPANSVLTTLTWWTDRSPVPFFPLFGQIILTRKNEQSLACLTLVTDFIIAQMEP